MAAKVQPMMIYCSIDEQKPMNKDIIAQIQRKNKANNYIAAIAII